MYNICVSVYGLYGIFWIIIWAVLYVQCKLCDNRSIDSESGINFVGVSVCVRASGQGYAKTFRTRISEHPVLQAPHPKRQLIPFPATSTNNYQVLSRCFSISNNSVASHHISGHPLSHSTVRHCLWLWYELQTLSIEFDGFLDWSITMLSSLQMANRELFTRQHQSITSRSHSNRTILKTCSNIRAESSTQAE